MPNDPKAEAAVRFLCVCGSSWISPAHGRCEACGRQRPQYSIGEHAGYLAGWEARGVEVEEYLCVKGACRQCCDPIRAALGKDDE